MKQREAFEKWARGKGYALLKTGLNQYFYSDAAAAWDAWQAARESEGGEAVVQVDCFPCWSRLELIGETDKDCPECAGVGYYFETVCTTPQPDK